MNTLIGALLRQRLVVFLILGLVAFAGVSTAPFDWDLGAVPRDPVPVDAIPNIGEAQQIVITEWPGRSPRDVEDQITYPLTTALLGTPGVETARSLSMFGVSSVSLILEDGVDLYEARSRILERLSSLPPQTLPPDVSPSLGPDATALGQVFWYTLEGRTPDGEPAGGWSLDELRATQDFLVRPALQAAAGVSEVASIGGFQREYQIDVDPEKLRHHRVTLAQVTAAVRTSNRDVGASTAEVNAMEYIVRGVGTVRSLEDLRAIVVRAEGGVPITLEQVARVRMGPAERRGALDKDGVEAVGGIVAARWGANPRATIDAIKDEIATIAPGLPERTLEDGTKSRVTVVPFYDRTGLIGETVETLEGALIDQMLITTLVIVLMLFNLRSSLLVSALLPLAVLITFALMKALSVEANVVALVGIAIAIGTMVDVGVVVVENTVAQLDRADPEEPRIQVIQRAVVEVAGAVLTAVATTVVSFLPVFALEGAEGRLFSPLAWTKTLALIAAAFVAVVVLPAALTVLFPRGRARPAGSARSPARRRWSRLGRWTFATMIAVPCAWLLAQHWRPLGPGAPALDSFLFVAIAVGGLLVTFYGFRLVYERLLRGFLAHPLLFVAVPGAVLTVGASAWLGGEAVWGWLPDSATAGVRERMPGMASGFLPDLDEGDFLYMPSVMPHGSIGTGLDAMREIDRRIAALPEVEHAVGKLGRAESALDPAPVGMIETVVILAPEWGRDDAGDRVRNWRPEIRTKADVWQAIADAASGVPELTSAPPLQPIRTRIVMLASGMRGDLGVRVQGPDVSTVEGFALDLERLLREGLPEAAAPLADRATGKPYLEATPDRDAIARYGLTIEDVMQTIEVAVGGVPLSRTIEGREGYPIRVRYPLERRLSPEALADVWVGSSSDPERQVPLGAVARIETRSGPQAIKSEDGFKTSYVTFNAARDPDTGQRFGLTAVVEAVLDRIETARDAGDLTVPPGVRFEMAGDWEEKVRADERLALLIPVALVIIAILLQLQLRSVTTTLIVFCGVAVAMGGGFIMLWAWGQPGFLDVSVFGTNLRDIFHVGPVELTVGVWVGFIALLGIATDDGVVMATYLQQRFARDRPANAAEVVEAVVDAGKRRIRPCLMTTATTVLALLPVLTSTGKGADVMVPMAIPVFGGMLFELVTLFVVPVLYGSWQLASMRLRGAVVAPPGPPNAAEVV